MAGVVKAKVPFTLAVPLVKVVLAADPLNPPAAGTSGTELLRQLVLDPVYQLK